ncbi:MAG: hypothetical protein ACOX4I_03110 [Anaerovoracaceae bacterium]|jgi:hypothetical protein
MWDKKTAGRLHNPMNRSGRAEQGGASIYFLPVLPLQAQKYSFFLFAF